MWDSLRPARVQKRCLLSRESSWDVMLATYLHLMPWLKVHEFRSAYLYYLFHLHGMVHPVAQGKMYLGNIKKVIN
jgi:hypothetical protein